MISSSSEPWPSAVRVTPHLPLIGGVAVTPDIAHRLEASSRIGVSVLDSGNSLSPSADGRSSSASESAIRAMYWV